MVDKVCYIVNDRDKTFETNKITEEAQISNEDEKCRELSDLASSCNPFDSWIDIKRATDKITTNGVKIMIDN